MSARFRFNGRIFRESPLACYLVLACTFTWSLLPLASNSVVIGLVALFGPALSAAAVSRFHQSDRKQLFAGQAGGWRCTMRWSLFALLLPIPVTALRSAIEYAFGARGDWVLQPVTFLGLIVFFLVVGEECGWRGFALPLLLPRYGPVIASVIVGGMWALWHLPLFSMPSMPQYNTPYFAFVIYTVALSGILTILYEKTHGSIIVATLFHGAVNTIGIVNTSSSSELRGWSNAVSYGLVALLFSGALWILKKGLSDSISDSAVPQDSLALRGNQ